MFRGCAYRADAKRGCGRRRRREAPRQAARFRRDRPSGAGSPRRNLLRKTPRAQSRSQPVYVPHNTCMSAPKRSTSSTARAREHQSRRRGVGSQAGDENNDALNEPEDVESTPKLEKQLFRQRGRRTVQVLGRPHGVAGDAHRRAPHAAAEKAWWTTIRILGTLPDPHHAECPSRHVDRRLSRGGEGGVIASSRRRPHRSRVPGHRKTISHNLDFFCCHDVGSLCPGPKGSMQRAADAEESDPQCEYLPICWRAGLASRAGEASRAQRPPACCLLGHTAERTPPAGL